MLLCTTYGCVPILVTAYYGHVLKHFSLPRCFNLTTTIIYGSLVMLYYVMLCHVAGAQGQAGRGRKPGRASSPIAKCRGNLIATEESLVFLFVFQITCL